jgi:PTH1 family peptidyl-tRNA hydrolase
VGLGNPGKDYEKTYHNAGFLALQYLARGAEKKWKKGAANWEYLKTGEKILVRPLTFMNNSGQAVKSALAYFKAPPEDLLVVHDDSDLPLGKFKLAFGRGSAGHKGVESIQKALQTKDLWRLRLGIRPATAKRAKAADFVLKKVSPAGLKAIYSALDGTKLNVTEN